MSDITTINPTTPAVRRPRQRVAEIKLPDGETLVPRADFANKVGVSEKTCKRWDLPTTYIAGVAYVQQNSSLKIIAGTVRRRNQPAARLPHRGPRKGRLLADNT
jgi:hypothetical protein